MVLKAAFSVSPVVACVLFVQLVMPSGQACAQENDEQQAESKASSALESGALDVPVYPRLKPIEGLKDIESLKDSFVVLEDGAVVSLADWVLGSLTKSKVHAGMSDYQNRLFLGQVARAVAGLDENMVHHSFENAGPLRPFVPHTPPAALQAAQGLLSYFVPALVPGWSPIVPEIALASHRSQQESATFQFNKQFEEAMAQSSADLVYFGTLSNMLKVNPSGPAN